MQGRSRVLEVLAAKELATVDWKRALSAPGVALTRLGEQIKDHVPALETVILL